MDRRQGKVRGFNTGRLYQVAGQRISWALIDGKVYFNDHSRGIWGVLKQAYHAGNISPQILMSNYDHHEYTMDGSGIASNLDARDWPLIRL